MVGEPRVRIIKHPMVYLVFNYLSHEHSVNESEENKPERPRASDLKNGMPQGLEINFDAELLSLVESKHYVVQPICYVDLVV